MLFDQRKSLWVLWDAIIWVFKDSKKRKSVGAKRAFCESDKELFPATTVNVWL